MLRTVLLIKKIKLSSSYLRCLKQFSPNFDFAIKLLQCIALCIGVYIAQNAIFIHSDKKITKILSHKT